MERPTVRQAVGVRVAREGRGWEARRPTGDWPLLQGASRSSQLPQEPKHSTVVCLQNTRARWGRSLPVASDGIFNEAEGLDELDAVVDASLLVRLPRESRAGVACRARRGVHSEQHVLSAQPFA